MVYVYYIRVWCIREISASYRGSVPIPVLYRLLHTTSLFFLFLLIFSDLAPKLAEVKSKGIRRGISGRNGMEGLSRPLSAYVPNKEALYGPTPKEKMHTRHLTYFNDKTIFVDGDAWHNVLAYLGAVLELEKYEAAQTIWKDYKDLDFIKKITMRQSNHPLMKKSGLFTLLKTWTPKKTDYVRMRELALDCLPQFIAEDASNIANGGVKAASSAPMQQDCSPVQAPDTSPIQVMLACAHTVRIAQLITSFTGERDGRAGAVNGL